MQQVVVYHPDCTGCGFGPVDWCDIGCRVYDDWDKFIFPIIINVPCPDKVYTPEPLTEFGKRNKEVMDAASAEAARIKRWEEDNDMIPF